jgi:predicted regulator of Ras-like GTPase activity (Roadblock/LC7/MglB family)
MDRQGLLEELRELRAIVPGVTGTLVAAADGRLLATDTGKGVDAASLAAAAVANLDMARRITDVTRQGTLGQTVVHGRRGHVAVYAIADAALLAVLGDEGLDVPTLHRRSRPALARILHIIADGGA